MSKLTIVALDAMGGDNAPSEMVKGAVDAVNLNKDIKVILVGQEDVVKAELAKHTYSNDQIEIMNATEVIQNGIAITDDEIRCKFIDDALQGVKNCIDDNIPVKGYCYWSLLDNFEWQKGYSMTFGLIAVDRDTMKREEKPSLRHLGSYI